MAPSYIPTEKALSDLFPVMPNTLSDVASAEKSVVPLKHLASHLYKEPLTFHTIHYRPTPLKSVILHLEKILFNAKITKAL